MIEKGIKIMEWVIAGVLVVLAIIIGLVRWILNFVDFLAEIEEDE